jgi:hypothetical protein
MERFDPIPSCGDHMTLQKFIRACANGELVDDDGHGHYAFTTTMSDTVVHPSDIVCGLIDHSYTHVVWFNQ